MQSTTFRFFRLGSVFLLTIAAMLFATHSLSATPKSDPAYRYTVNGTLRNIGAVTSTGSREVIIKHEAIPDYRDETGKTTGMMAMTMPFYLEDGVGTGDLSSGDPVEFVVAQWSEPAFRERIISIRRHEKPAN